MDNFTFSCGQIPGAIGIPGVEPSPALVDNFTRGDNFYLVWLSKYYLVDSFNLIRWIIEMNSWYSLRL